MTIIQYGREDFPVRGNQEGNWESKIAEAGCFPIHNR
jgi:hypothetical protein